MFGLFGHSKEQEERLNFLDRYIEQMRKSREDGRTKFLPGLTTLYKALQLGDRVASLRVERRPEGLIITEASPSIEKVTGYSPDQVIGVDIRSMMPKGAEHMASRIMDHADATGISKVESIVETPLGVIRLDKTVYPSGKNTYTEFIVRVDEDSVFDFTQHLNGRETH